MLLCIVIPAGYNVVPRMHIITDTFTSTFWPTDVGVLDSLADPSSDYLLQRACTPAIRPLE